MYLNTCTVIGNLTRDPELKALPSGLSVASFSVATNRKWKDKDGNLQEEVDFHNIVVFGKQAENVAQYMKKGSHILVQGRLKTQSWEKDGHKNYRTEIVAENVTYGRKSETSSSTQSAPPPQQGSESVVPDYPEEEINPEDIPF